MPRSFNESEKENIHQNLIAECKKSEESLTAKLIAAGIKLKVSKDRAREIIDTLLLTVVNKEHIKDHFEIFCMLLDCMIDEIYE